MDSFWQRQSPTNPLFPDIEWSKPEQRARAGRLAIIGGNKHGFMAVSDAYRLAKETGAGEVRIILPDILKKTIPIVSDDVRFMMSNISGGFSKEATDEIVASANWSEVCLLIGDMGKNSETAMVCEQLVDQFSGTLVVTRDSIELFKPITERLVERPKTTIVASFSQLQKIFQRTYYPRILSFSMQLMQLVDALHKFTVTYPVTIVTFHQNQLIVSHGGQVVSQEFTEPMAIWHGLIATKNACYLLWSPDKPLDAIATSFSATN